MNGSEESPAAPAASKATQFLWPATAVLLLAAIMRLVLLAEVPPGLSQDEVLNAGIATFIRQGEHAIFFRHGYGHEPLYHYLTVPFQVFLGDNVLAIRLPAVFLGLLLVAITMRWARRDFTLMVALVAGFGLAISWWPIIFSRVGLRPILEPFLLVLAVWFWPRRPWLAGLFLGLSIYSYTAARTIFLLPLAMFLYLILFHRRRDLSFRSRPHSLDNPRTALIVFLVSFAFFIPLAVTLQLNPGLQQRVDQLSGPLAALGRGDLRPLWETVRATLGVFSFTGDPRWTYSLPGRPLFEPLAATLFYGGLAISFWRWRRSKYALLLLWLGLAMLPSAITPDAPSTIRLVGIIPLVYLMPGIALTFLQKRGQARDWRLGRNRGRNVLIPLLLILAVIAGLNLWRTVQDGFIRWPQELEARVKYQTVLQDMARYWEQDPVSRLVIAEAFFEPIDADSFLRNLGQDPGTRWVQSGQDVAGAVVLPIGGGEGRMYVPEFAPPPAALLEAAGISSQPRYRSQSSPSFAVYDLPDSPPPPDHSIGITLEGMFTLLGHTMLEKGPEQLRLVTYWQLEAPIDAGLATADLAVFTHLIAADDSLLAQHDGLDVALATLQSGDLIIQYHVLPLPEELPQGPLTLQVGLYQRSDGRRLLHEGSPADRIILDFD